MHVSVKVFLGVLGDNSRRLPLEFHLFKGFLNVCSMVFAPHEKLEVLEGSIRLYHPDLNAEVAGRTLGFASVLRQIL